MTNADIMQLCKEMRAKRFMNSPQLTLGQFIEEIEKCGTIQSADKSKTIEFDFGTAIPTTLDSWRGSYDELALGYRLSGYENKGEHFAEVTAESLLSELKGSIGSIYEGWKGGDFCMTKDTPVWVANPGNSGNTGIIGVLDKGYSLIILTAYCEF